MQFRDLGAQYAALKDGIDAGDRPRVGAWPLHRRP